MSNGSSSSAAMQVVTGTVIALGLATVLWVVLTRRTTTFGMDPQVEIDKRIDSLEVSLNRLQDVFGQTVGG